MWWEDREGRRPLQAASGSELGPGQLQGQPLVTGGTLPAQPCGQHRTPRPPPDLERSPGGKEDELNFAFKNWHNVIS